MADGRRIAVSNTSPIIALASIGELRLLGAMFDALVVPLEVWFELADPPNAPEIEGLLGLGNLRLRAPRTSPPSEARNLQPGERDAITIGLEERGSFVLLDDGPARKVAARLRLHVMGTLGILAEAKRRGLVIAARPLLDRLVSTGFRIRLEIANRLLRSLDEADLD